MRASLIKTRLRTNLEHQIDKGRSEVLAAETTDQSNCKAVKTALKPPTITLSAIRTTLKEAPKKKIGNTLRITLQGYTKDAIDALSRINCGS